MKAAVSLNRAQLLRVRGGASAGRTQPPSHCVLRSSVAIALSLAFCTAAALAAAPFRGAFVSTPIPPLTTAHIPTAAADLNEDGRPDVVGFTRGLVQSLVGKGDGSFEPVRWARIDGETGANFVLADFTGDGHLDVVTATHLLPGRGDGSFGISRWFPPCRCFTEANPVPVVADVSGDGIPDLVIACASDNRLYVRLGHGGGLVDSVVATTPSFGASCLAIADVDGDGRADLALSDGTSHAEVRRGTGDGGFASVVFSCASGRRVWLRDLDGDGRVDLVVGHSLFLGDGHGGFAAAGALPFDVAGIADLDLDGRLELVGVDSTSVLIGARDGAGHFGAVTRLLTRCCRRSRRN